MFTNDMQRHPLSFNEDISLKQTPLAFWIGLNDHSLEDHLDHIFLGETLFDRMLHSMIPDGKVAENTLSHFHALGCPMGHGGLP